MAKYAVQGRVIVITGATGGLGSRLAEALIARGARLALLDIDEPALAAQTARLSEHGEAACWVADVCSLESLADAMHKAADHFGGVDVVVANAGIDVMTPLATMTPEAFERVIDINLNGVWRTVQAGLVHVARRDGHLLAISSMAAFVHSPLQGAYCASKAGVWALCNSLRLEVAHLGVTVGSVHPTFFKTPLLAGIADGAAGQKIWRGNRTGLWKTVPIESVVARIVAGIEARSQMIVIPRHHWAVALAPVLFRRLLEWLGFRNADVADAVRLAAPPDTKKADRG